MPPKRTAHTALGDKTRPLKIQRQITLDAYKTVPQIKICTAEEMTKAVLETPFTSFFSIPFTLVPEGMPSDISVEAQTEQVKLLSREIALKFIKLISNQAQQQKITHNGCVLVGPAGVGKSSLLLHLVVFCRLTGWLVIYIPKGNLYSGKETINAECFKWLSTTLDCELTTSKLMTIKFKSKGVIPSIPNDVVTLYDLVRFGAQHLVLAEDIAQLLIQEIGLVTEYPVFLAVDQWNGIVRSSNKFCKLFHNFSTMNLLKGMIFFAVSSSCDPIPHMQDGDSMIFIESITPYTSGEFLSIVQLAIFQKAVPEIEPNSYIMNEIGNQTGYLPRMVKTLMSLWAKNGPTTDTIDTQLKNLLPAYISTTTNYFSERVKKVMSRADEKDVKATHQFAANVYLHKKLVATTISPLWAISGLVMRVNDEFIVSCPPARKAITDVLHDEKDSIILVLSSYKETLWKALELLVVSKFMRGAATVNIPNINLLGELQNPSTLSLQVSTVIIQPSPNESVYELQTLSHGQLLICHPGHPVVDYVLYSHSGELFFIQVSTSKYGDHDKKVTDLNKSELKMKDNKKITVLNYYLKCVGKCQHNLVKSLPEKCYYLYVTTREKYTNKSSNTKHPVVLVNQAATLAQFGSGWDAIQQAAQKFELVK